jgi:Mg-chelatase subunit ChlD
VTVVAQRIGYAEARQTGTLVSGANTVDFTLTEEALRLDEVIVTGTVSPVQRRATANVVTTAAARSQALPGRFVFLLDVSGSMNGPDKLPLLKTAFGLLVEQLRPEDRVAIVVYAGAAGLALPSTPGSDKEAILDALEGLHAGGSTAGGAGIRLAYAVAAENHIQGGNNRVILATDGDFNVGASSDSEMIRLIEEKREQGTFLTVLGFGTGNLQDAKMEQIADHGNGNSPTSTASSRPRRCASARWAERCSPS